MATFRLQKLPDIAISCSDGDNEPQDSARRLAASCEIGRFEEEDSWEQASEPRPLLSLRPSESGSLTLTLASKQQSKRRHSWMVGMAGYVHCTLELTSSIKLHCGVASDKRMASVSKHGRDVRMCWLVSVDNATIVNALQTLICRAASAGSARHSSGRLPVWHTAVYLCNRR